MAWNGLWRYEAKKCSCRGRGEVVGVDAAVACGSVQKPDRVDGTPERVGDCTMVQRRNQAHELEKQRLQLQGIEESTSTTDNEGERDHETMLHIGGEVQPDQRGLQVTLPEWTFASPMSFDAIHKGDYRTIATMPGFVRAAVIDELDDT